MARPVSPQQAQSREHLLTAGLQAIWKTGYHATGLQDILAAAGVPRGSFYHHFGSKEAFGSEVIARYAQAATTARRAILHSAASSPLQRVRQHFLALAEDFTASGWTEGCLLGNLSAEMVDHSDPLREAVRQAFADWQQDLSAVLAEAVEAGELPPNSDPDALAAFCLNSWEGALLRMRTERSDKPLTLFLKLMFERVLVRA